MNLHNLCNARWPTCPILILHLAFSTPANWLPHSVYRLGQNGSASRRYDADCNLLSMLDTETCDAQPVYTGLAYEDIAKRLQCIFGSAFTSSHGGELSSLCQMVYDRWDLQLQEALLQTIYDNQAILTSSSMLIRSFSRLLWSSGSCGDSGQGTKQGQAGHGAAAPVLNLAEADGAAGAISTRRTARKKTKKRPQQSAKQARTEAPVTAPQHGAQPQAADQEDEVENEAGSGDDDLVSLISACTQQRQQQQQRRPIQCRVPSANAESPRCVKTLSLT